jgi:hypothetical protein
MFHNTDICKALGKQIHALLNGSGTEMVEFVLEYRNLLFAFLQRKYHPNMTNSLVTKKICPVTE